MYESRTYALGMKIKEKFPGGMYLSAESPSRSLRSQPYEDSELVILVGEEHKTGQHKEASEHYRKLEAFAREHYEVEDILYHWSAQDCMPLDDIPYIGRITSTAANMYVATGFKKWGMTHSVVGAAIIRDQILNRQTLGKKYIILQGLPLSSRLRNSLKSMQMWQRNLFQGN